MPTSDPVNLVAAIILVSIGVFLGLGLLAAVVREFRRKKELLADGPDVSGYEPDLYRYTQRVWLLVAEWRPRLDPGPAEELDQMWEDLVERIEVFRVARSEGDETASGVAALVEAEKAIEDFIAEARSD